MKVPADVNLGALTAGIVALFSAVGGLTATGTLGRLQRNEPDLLTAAVLIVLLGTAMLVIAGLPVTSGASELFATLVGTGLIIIGVGWAVVTGILATGQAGRPTIGVELTSAGAIKGKVTVGSLASGGRLAVLVEGVTGASVEPIGRYSVGSDADGEVELPVSAPVPAAGFATVQVKALTGEQTELQGTCDEIEAAEDAEEADDDARAACLSLPLSPPTTPRLSLSWEGTEAAARSLRVGLAAERADRRIAIVVAGQRPSKAVALYRAVVGTNQLGPYRTAVRLPVGRRYRRVCALAYFAAETGPRSGIPRRPLPCPIGGGLTRDDVGAEIRQPIAFK